MELDSETLVRLDRKRNYKLSGDFLSFGWVKPSICNLVLTKGTQKAKKQYVFTSFGNVSLQLAEILENKKFIGRIKVWFDISCREYNGKMYTSLVVKHFEVVQVGEAKRQKEVIRLAKLALFG